MFTLARSCNAAKTTEPMLHLARSHLPYRPCKKKPLALGSPWTPRLFAENQVRLPRVQSFPVDFVSIRNAVFSPPQKKKKETKRTQRHVDMTRLVNPTSHVLHDSHLPLGDLQSRTEPTMAIFIGSAFSQLGGDSWSILGPTAESPGLLIVCSTSPNMPPCLLFVETRHQ